MWSFTSARPELPPVTQCETEDGTTGGRVLIVQFDDQIQNMVEENLDASEDMAINFPIDAVAQHLKFVRDELEVLRRSSLPFETGAKPSLRFPPLRWLSTSTAR